MRYFLLAILLNIIPTSALANDFGLSINIGQPGFYGQINLGNNYPRPQLINPQPILIREVGRNEWEHQSPVYLHVPPNHSHNWHQHCHRYQACNQPVYFVRENWYNDVYVPHHSSYSNRRYDSHRDHDDHYYQERRHDRGKYKYGHDKHRGKHDKRHHDKKYDKRHHDKKHRDRDHGRH